MLKEVDAEINYLSQVQTSLNQLQNQQSSSSEDLQALEEIKEELIQQGYLEAERQETDKVDRDSQPYRYSCAFRIRNLGRA